MTNQYRELHVWQKSIELTKEIYSVTKDFPKEELYGLTSQIRRAAVSVASNIAEGQARYSRKEFAKFLLYSVGSLAEIDTQLEIAKALHYIDEQRKESLDMKLMECRKMLMGLKSKVIVSCPQ